MREIRKKQLLNIIDEYKTAYAYSTNFGITTS